MDHEQEARRMPLIVDKTTAVFDLSQIGKGDLLYARHKTWPEGKGGFVTRAAEDELTVQYDPGIGSVTNHFFLPVREAAGGEWEIRWSPDLISVREYGKEGGGKDDAGSAGTETSG